MMPQSVFWQPEDLQLPLIQTHMHIAPFLLIKILLKMNMLKAYKQWVTNMALTKCATKAIWLRRLLRYLHFKEISLMTIFSNNQNIIAMLNSTKFLNRKKHIDIEYHFIRDKILQSKSKFLIVLRRTWWPIFLLNP